jgi:hypothetical protein
MIEPASSYVKGIIALIILTEVFRVSDLIVNWDFLSTAPGYLSFFQYDVMFVVAGIFLVVLALLSVKMGVAIGFSYSVAGLLLTVSDPDFPHFLGNPLGYILGMELPVSLLFTLGTFVLITMLIIGIRGYISLGRSTNEVESG